jgi:hypothetical protein
MYELGTTAGGKDGVALAAVVHLVRLLRHPRRLGQTPDMSKRVDNARAPTANFFDTRIVTKGRPRHARPGASKSLTAIRISELTAPGALAVAPTT